MAVLISKNLEEYQNLAAEELKKAVKRAGKTVREEIQSNAPVKSGRYSKSWKTKIISENSTSIELIVYNKSEVWTADEKLYEVLYTTEIISNHTSNHISTHS